MNPTVRLQRFVDAQPTRAKAARKLGIRREWLMEMYHGRIDVSKPVLAQLDEWEATWQQLSQR